MMERSRTERDERPDPRRPGHPGGEGGPMVELRADIATYDDRAARSAACRPQVASRGRREEAWLRITFHGATRQVTGSAHLLEVGSRRILLDCGLFDSERIHPESPNRH